MPLSNNLSQATQKPSHCCLSSPMPSCSSDPARPQPLQLQLSDGRACLSLLARWETPPGNRFALVYPTGYVESMKE